jgi:hypothetical protein
LNKDVKEDLKKNSSFASLLISGNIISMPSLLGVTKIRIAPLNILNLLFLPVRTESYQWLILLAFVRADLTHKKFSEGQRISLENPSDKI